MMHIINLGGYSAVHAGGRLELGTFDSYGEEQLQVIKGYDWQNLNVIATFNPPSKKPVRVVVDAVTGIVDVPPEATANQYGMGTIVFVGLADGVQRISADLEYIVKKHSNAEGDEPAEPTPSVVQQILTAAQDAQNVASEAKDVSQDAKDIAQSVRDDADQGKFKGDKGDKGDAGDKGEKGDKGDKGEDALVDDTLSKAGEAADAQRVGEELSSIKQSIIDAHERQNVLVGYAIGNPAECNNSVNESLRGLIVYGKSTQSGTPSPDSPAEISVVGADGSVKVTFSDDDSQSKTIAFSAQNGLRGIPVSSGGNVFYNGQMYIADYIDAERGKLVRRIGRKNISDEIVDKSNDLTFRATDGGYELGSDGNSFFDFDLQAMSSQLQVMSNGDIYKNSDGYAISKQWVSLPRSYASKGEYAIFFHTNTIYLDYVLSTPVETDLTQDEISAYKEFLAYSPKTVVTAGDGAISEVTYQQDINSMIGSIVRAISQIGGDLTGKEIEKTWLITS